MRKRIYLAALCLGAALAMAGCSDGSTNENDDNTTSSVSGQTESGTEADSGERLTGREMMLLWRNWKLCLLWTESSFWRIVSGWESTKGWS